MSRILLAWELGANLGHLAQLAAIAVPLRDMGHRPLFAVRDVAGAARLLLPQRFEFVQAPALLRHKRASAPPANHAEMLALEGYSDLSTARALIGSWLTLVRASGAEAIVADCSPGALIAGRILSLPCVQVGTGFAIPPLAQPLPSIRPWESIPESRLRRSERQVTELANRLIRSCRGPELYALADLFRTEGRVLATFPELDPFGPRVGEGYVGPIFPERLGDRPQWPAPSSPRILAYLRGDVRGAHSIAQALAQTDAATICFYPGGRGTLLRELSSRGMCIAPRPIELGRALREADLVVTYGGHGLVGAAMSAGVPLLVAPHTIEQYLHARRAEAAGVASLIGAERGVAAVRERISHALSNPKLRQGAREFAIRLRGFEPHQAVAAATARVRAVIGEPGVAR